MPLCLWIQLDFRMDTKVRRGSEQVARPGKSRSLCQLEPPDLKSQLAVERAARIRAEQRERELEAEVARGSSETQLLRRTAIHATKSASVRGILQPVLAFFGEHWECELATAWVIASANDERWQHAGSWYFRDEVREPAFRECCVGNLPTVDQLVGAESIQSERIQIVELADISKRSEFARVASWMGLEKALTIPVLMPDEEVAVVLEFHFFELNEAPEAFAETGLFIASQVAKVFERELLYRQIEASRLKMQEQVVDQSREIGRLATQNQYTEGLFRGIVDGLVEAVFKTDTEGRISLLNEYWHTLTGWEIDQCLGQGIKDYVVEEASPLMEHLWESMKAENEAVQGVTFQLRGADNRERWAELSARPLVNPVDGTLMIVGTFFDVTERHLAEDKLRRANQELERAAKLKDRFLAAMSHELRTPLNSVLGFSEVLATGTHGPLNAAQRGAVGNIAESGSHLLSLIDDILDLSKIQAGKQRLELRELGLREILESCLNMVHSRANEKSIDLQLALQTEDQVIVADARRFKQIIVNLLGNAVKFTPDHGRVHLRSARDDANAQLNITVEDTGIGISEEDQARLFQPFVQLDGELSRRYAGTGLGLMLAKSLAELHEGTIELRSVRGQGSSFTVKLPLSLEPNVDASEEASEATVCLDQSEGRKSPLILVVDDDDKNRLLTKAFLKAKKYRVETAPDGLTAIALASELKPDLILMDIQMPGLDGIETTRRIKESPGTGNIPIIAVTALAMVGDREKCLESGAEDYVSKPVQMHELLARVARGLNFHSCKSNS